MGEKKYNTDTVVRGLITVAVLVALYLLVRRLYNVLLPFVLSWLIAYLMDPLVDFFQHKCRLRFRALSVVVTLLVVVLFLVGFGFLLIPPMVREMGTLSEYVTHYVANFNANEHFSPELAARYEELMATMNVDTLMQHPDVVAAIKRVAPQLWALLTGSLSALSSLAVVFVCMLYVFFILLDFDDLANAWSGFVPKKYRQQAELLMSDLSKNLNGYFRGQGIIATCVGILFALGFSAIGLPMGIGMGLFIGLLNMIPYMQVLAIPPCLLLAVLQGAETGRPIWLCVLLVVVVFLVVQSVQDFLLTPKIMGNVTGMNPAIILLSLSVWGSLLGIIGMIIALPITSVIISYYKRFLNK